MLNQIKRNLQILQIFHKLIDCHNILRKLVCNYQHIIASIGALIAVRKVYFKKVKKKLSNFGSR